MKTYNNGSNCIMPCAIVTLLLGRNPELDELIKAQPLKQDSGFVVEDIEGEENFFVHGYNKPLTVEDVDTHFEFVTDYANWLAETHPEADVNANMIQDENSVIRDAFVKCKDLSETLITEFEKFSFPTELVGLVSKGRRVTCINHVACLTAVKPNEEQPTITECILEVLPDTNDGLVGQIKVLCNSADNYKICSVVSRLD